jgi:hypothetical protein
MYLKAGPRRRHARAAEVDFRPLQRRGVDVARGPVRHMLLATIARRRRTTTSSSATEPQRHEPAVRDGPRRRGLVARTVFYYNCRRHAARAHKLHGAHLQPSKSGMVGLG